MTERLVLEVSPAQRRRVKSLAAGSGMTMKDFVLSRVLGDRSNGKAGVKPKAPADEDETACLMRSRTMQKRIMDAVQEPAARRKKFNSLKDLQHALGA